MQFLTENLSLYSIKEIKFTKFISILTLTYCDVHSNSNSGGFFIHETISVAHIFLFHALSELKNYGIPGIYFYFKLVALEWHHFNPRHHECLQRAAESFHHEGVLQKWKLRGQWIKYSIQSLLYVKSQQKILFGIQLSSLQNWVAYLIDTKAMLATHSYPHLMSWTKPDKPY
jgi:hypothetical protein